MTNSRESTWPLCDFQAFFARSVWTHNVEKVSSVSVCLSVCLSIHTLQISYILYRMVFKERKKCNSVATGSGVTIERNEKKHKYRKFPILLGWRNFMHTFLDYLETGKWRMKFLKDKWLRINIGVAYRYILRSNHKDEIKNLGQQFDKIKYQWFNRTKVNVNVTAQV